MRIHHFLIAMLVGGMQYACAADSLVSTAHYANGEVIPYILTTETENPKYVLILMPGGSGRLEPHMEGDTLEFRAKGNFLIRSRSLFGSGDFAAVSTDATASEERMQALIDDIHQRFPIAAIYLLGTSRSTEATMRLAPYLSERIAGVIHTSSMKEIMWFDTRPLKNRQLIVHHRNDTCKVTRYDAAQTAAQKFGTDFITMEGGIAVGDACEAFAHHGYNGIENETVEAIKAWIRKA